MDTSPAFSKPHKRKRRSSPLVVKAEPEPLSSSPLPSEQSMFSSFAAPNRLLHGEGHKIDKPNKTSSKLHAKAKKEESSHTTVSAPSAAIKPEAVSEASSSSTVKSKSAKAKKATPKVIAKLSDEACTSLFTDRYIYGAYTRWWPWPASEFNQATQKEIDEVAHLDTHAQERYRYLLERSKNMQEIVWAKLNSDEASIEFTVCLENDQDRTAVVLEQNLDPILRESFYLDNWPFMQKLKEDQRVLLDARGTVDPVLPAGFVELSDRLKELSDLRLLDNAEDQQQDEEKTGAEENADGNSEVESDR